VFLISPPSRSLAFWCLAAHVKSLTFSALLAIWNVLIFWCSPFSKRYSFSFPWLRQTTSYEIPFPPPQCSGESILFPHPFLFFAYPPCSLWRFSPFEDFSLPAATFVQHSNVFVNCLVSHPPRAKFLPPDGSPMTSLPLVMGVFDVHLPLFLPPKASSARSEPTSPVLFCRPSSPSFRF